VDVLADVVSAMRSGPTMSAQAELQAPWGLRLAPAPGAMFHVVLRGTSWLLTGDGTRPILLGPGDVALLPHGPGHVLADHQETQPVDFSPAQAAGRPPALPAPAADGPRSLLLCGLYQVERQRPHPLLATLPAVVHVPADPDRHRSLHAVIASLADETSSRRLGAAAVIAAFVDAMLPLILRAWMDAKPGNPEAPGWSAAFSDPAVALALEAIHAAPARAWTVSVLADEVCLSRATLARRFRTATGESPVSYLTQWRMTLAGRLLRDTSVSTASVAASVGYSSEFAFAKAFKRAYGIGPGAYRRRVLAA
jgi:AraC-like DNA-binding protein